MVRISVPTIPQATLSSSLAAAANAISPKQATERIADFLGGGNVTVITGAGVSVDSGIRAYRGAKGRYLNPNYQPIFYHELMDESEKGFAYRQRYWLRSYLGYQPVRDALPNPTHYALAALQYKSIVPQLITQNVDGLHHKALSHVWDQERLKQHILELHGSLHNVHCKFGHVVDRDTFQDWLSIANPQWKEFMDNMESTGQKPRTNPDGDVVLEGAQYDDFVVPPCPKCREEGRDNNTQKPELIFFGESIKPEVRQRSYKDIETADRLFLVGTTLATFSAFRLLKHALELKKPVLYLNVGPTRADGLPGIEKIEIPSGLIMRDVVKAVLATDSVYDPVVGDMLRNGVVKPPPDDAPDS
ncbi:DHS-like NAD/FAD-binding domain-containing protein [Abortiporus biennis]|nr:DHS-like NAD/FAD-binding domain-containing protein [Abortiporus biennis]